MKRGVEWKIRAANPITNINSTFSRLCKQLSPTAELRSFHRKMGESKRGVTTERGSSKARLPPGIPLGLSSPGLPLGLPPVGFGSPLTPPPPIWGLEQGEETKENNNPKQPQGKFLAALLSPPKASVGVIGSNRAVLTPNHSPPPSLSPELKVVKRPRRKSAARVISYEEPSSAAKIRRGHVFFPKEGK